MLALTVAETCDMPHPCTVNWLQPISMEFSTC